MARHQDRAWFEANKGIYERALREPMEALVATLSEELPKRRMPLHGDPKRSMFRIHRDVRFSHDKRPYKTNTGATLSRDGQKMSPGLLYLHVDPEGSFTAAGAWRPEPPDLAAIRTRITGRPALYRGMLKSLESAGLGLDEDEDALKRLPRGYEDVSAADLGAALRRRSFTVRKPLSAASLTKPALVAEIVAFAQSAAPLLAFIWKALDEKR